MILMITNARGRRPASITATHSGMGASGSQHGSSPWIAAADALTTACCASDGAMTPAGTTTPAAPSSPLSGSAGGRTRRWTIPSGGVAPSRSDAALQSQLRLSPANDLQQHHCFNATHDALLESLQSGRAVQRGRYQDTFYRFSIVDGSLHGTFECGQPGPVGGTEQGETVQSYGAFSLGPFEGQQLPLFFTHREDSSGGVAAPPSNGEPDAFVRLGRGDSAPQLWVVCRKHGDEWESPFHFVASRAGPITERANDSDGSCGGRSIGCTTGETHRKHSTPVATHNLQQEQEQGSVEQTSSRLHTPSKNYHSPSWLRSDSPLD